MKKYRFALGLAVGFLTLAGRVSAQDAGKDLYNKQCKTCHAEDGSGTKDGKEFVGVCKTLLKSEKCEKLSLLTDEAKKLTDQQIEDSILKGKDKMKAMDQKVKPDEAKTIVAHVRALQAAKK